MGSANCFYPFGLRDKMNPNTDHADETDRKMNPNNPWSRQKENIYIIHLINNILKN